MFGIEEWNRKGLEHGLFLPGNKNPLQVKIFTFSIETF